MTEAEYEFKLATFGEFLALGPQVWRNWDLVKERCFLGMQAPGSRTVLAALWCSVPSTQEQQRASGNYILRAATRYELLLAPRAMTLTPEGRKKVLLHELVHVGYSGHGEKFRGLCKAVGGVISGAAVTEPGFHLEKKVGARFKRMMTFDTEKEAEAWMDSQTLQRAAERAALEAQGMSKREAFKMVRWRLIYG